MDGAISIIVVADRAIEKVIAENAVESFHLGSGSFRRLRGDAHPIGNFGRAGPDESAIRFHHACVTRLNRTKLRVVADVRNRAARAIEQINQEFIGFGFSNDAVNHNLGHSFFSPQLFVASPVSVAPQNEVRIHEHTIVFWKRLKNMDACGTDTRRGSLSSCYAHKMRLLCKHPSTKMRNIVQKLLIPEPSP